jgi:hypothetical protein
MRDEPCAGVSRFSAAGWKAPASRSSSAWWPKEDNEVGASEGLECLLDELLHLFGMDLDDGTRWCITDDRLQQQ